MIKTMGKTKNGVKYLTTVNFLYKICQHLKVFWPHRLMVRTPPFQGENPGSNPSGAAKNQKHPFGCFLFLLNPRV